MKKIVYFLISCTFFIYSITADAQSICLDNTFGNGGIVTTDIANVHNEGNAIITQPDGKILVSGNSYGSGIVLLRYNQNGSLDTTFGVSGITLNAFGTNINNGFDLTLQPDEKIIVVGQISNGTGSNQQYAITLLRYNINGSLDSSFGSGGIVLTALGLGFKEALSVALQTDGKIVACGELNGDLAVLRYKTNGDLDSTFATNGIASIHFTTGNTEYGYSVKIQDDGKIVVAGQSYTNSILMHYIIARLNVDGSIDINYGVGGKISGSMGSMSFAHSIDIQSNGKLIVAIDSTTTNGKEQRILLRYNVLGIIDTSFGACGKVITDVWGNGVLRVGQCLLVKPDDGILLTGIVSNGAFGSEYTVEKFTADGIIDSSFATNGIVRIPFGYTSATNSAYDITLQSDGKILIVGVKMNTLNSTYDILVTRLTRRLIFNDINHGKENCNINAFPNPFKSSTTIQFNTELNGAELTIYNIFGQNVKQLNNISGQNIILHRENLSCGVYIMRLIQKNKTLATTKLIITDD